MCTEEENATKSFTRLNEREFILETEKPFSRTIQAGMALENLTWTPDVEIRNCRFLSNRARGLLISTPGKVVVENNFFASSGSAILIAGDANYWYESGAVRDLLIRGNRFDASCLTSEYQFTEAVISILPEIPEPDPSRPFHRNHPHRGQPLLFGRLPDPVCHLGQWADFQRQHHRAKLRFPPVASAQGRNHGRRLHERADFRQQVVGEVLGRTVSIENMHKREVKIAPGSPYKVVWNKEAARPKLQK